MKRSGENPKLSDDYFYRLATRLGRRFASNGDILAAAESCTGGWIAKCVTDVAGSSGWFTDGFVTYGNRAKQMVLNVRSSTLEQHGAVSRQTAVAMARGALHRSGCSVAVAVTGIAGPGGAVPGKPVGTVWLCWARRRGSRVAIIVEVKTFRGDRDAVRRKTVRTALLGLLRI